MVVESVSGEVSFKRTQRTKLRNFHPPTHKNTAKFFPDSQIVYTYIGRSFGNQGVYSFSLVLIC